jgi:hypothetical protein
MCGITNEKGEKQRNHFNGILTTVDVIAEKKEAVLRRLTGQNKDSDQIGEVPVDVAHHVCRRGNLQEKRLGREDGPGLLKKLMHPRPFDHGDGHGRPDLMELVGHEAEKGGKHGKDAVGDREVGF